MTSFRPMTLPAQRPLPQRGFTLLELLVVLMIIGGLLSLVNLNASDTQIQDETGRFATTMVIAMNLYREEAAYRNLDLGLAMDRDELMLLSWQDVRQQAAKGTLSVEELSDIDKNPWQAYSSASLNAPTVPEGMVMALVIDDDDVDFEELLDNDEGPLPALQFLSSEEYTAFELTITHDADNSFAFVIHGDGFNPVWKEVVRYEQ
ncbi:type II secretion system minor pseudopilin GspH [Oceanobacter sp. 5_MG-2023]|uniref:type II secretion system minor pseudopilin GspH n=1 Tax=Oceanobacter sp. 5_MG-2023 TaxID=3062645 RepID=UPI0026E2B3C8|nr:type II secretion system minor pseudopilin GspH [Oceanobacter sp. 5_MG-2023]MDO6681155.1 type II secretion system minor pseudopilin GspH [Oceanobacter sp. 5_MG-2023]